MSAAPLLESHMAAGGRIWLVSDIHANATALGAFLDQIPGADAVILLGDLLTYGCAPQRTLELVERCLRSRPCALIVGNHDQLYRELLTGDCPYYAQLPDWLRESVDWTARQIDARWFSEQLPWQTELQLGPVLVAHANPFAPFDWTYLDKLEHYQRAADVIAERGFRLGIFGHVHRPRLLVRGEGKERWSTELVPATQLGAAATAAWNVGSLGQQRCQRSPETVGYLDGGGALLQIGHRPLQYDIEVHLEEIRAAQLSDATRERLLRFHQRDVS